MKVRKVIAYKIIEAIEFLERIPSGYLKFITGTNGLYEAQIQLASNYGAYSAFLMEKSWLFCSMDFRKRHRKRPKTRLINSSD
jgi:hypothetical protein